MKMEYYEAEEACFNEIKFTFIHYVFTSIKHYYISSSSPFFYTDFFKDKVQIEFEPPKIENKEKFLMFAKKITREVKKLEKMEKEVNKYES
ncbi:MAG: hypothetical protein ACO2PO_07190 [Candidatus Calescibacterium sp.]